MRIIYMFLTSVIACLASFVSAEAGITVGRLVTGNGSVILIVKGEFEFSDDGAALAEAVAASGARTVTFESNGGNVHAAMLFGRMIRRLQLDSVQIRSAQCASACSLAFVGGVKRDAEPGSIGVHRSSFSDDAKLDGAAAVATVQAMTAEILTYLIEMGVDPKLLQLSLSTDSSDMRYLTSTEMARLGVTSGASQLTRPNDVVAAPTEPSKTFASTPKADADNTRAQALVFVERYHQAWSLPAPKALAFMRSAYAETVSFYGKSISRDDVLKDKAAFVERWPQRAYSIRPGSERVVCSLTCSVKATIEWFARSAKRDKASAGAAEFSFIWNPVNGQIESESSQVTETDRSATYPSRIIAQWQKQNSACRGGPGNSDLTHRACDRREVVGAKLGAVGWCYGREGEYGYQMEWHVCGR